MSTKTGIEWTDATWNPLRGCSRVSEGCRNCYAEKVAYRFSGPGQPYEGLVRIGAAGERKAEWNGEVRLVEKHLLDPLRWKRIDVAPAHPPHGTIWRPRKIFVNSMSDLFHPNVPDEWIDLIFGVMAHAPQHIFQILTKRPERMLHWANAKEREMRVYDALVDSNLADERQNDRLICRAQDRILKYDTEYGRYFDCKWPLPNVWLGVSVENQKAADERIPLLLQTPAAVRFLSVEPMLGPVDLGRFLFADPTRPGRRLNQLHWAIVGGESGPGARPMHPEWARSLRDQCSAAGVAFFFKQWGEYVPEGPQYPEEYGAAFPEMHEAELCGKEFPEEGVLYRDGYFYDGVEHQPHINSGAWWMGRVGKHAVGALLDGREWREFPGGAV